MSEKVGTVPVYKCLGSPWDEFESRFINAIILLITYYLIYNISYYEKAIHYLPIFIIPFIGNWPNKYFDCPCKL